MFKSIFYKLILCLILLMVSVALLTYCLLEGYYVYALIPGLLIVTSLNALFSYYKRYDKNILFLLNAIENGDYLFNFAEVNLSTREKEINKVLNRIKEILVNARKEAIENEKFLSLIVESVSTGIVIFDERGNVQMVNNATNKLLGMPVFTHINQLKNIDESYPVLFSSLKPESNVQIKVVNEREEIQVSLRASIIKLKRGEMKVITLNNIGNELESREMESWIRLIRVMTHEIMNSIAPVTSLTDTLLFTYKMQRQAKETEDELIENTIEALDTINSTARGLLSFVDSYRKFTGVPKPQLANFKLIPVIEKVLQLEAHRFDENTIDFEIRSFDPQVELNADEAQITQVLVNLIKNAAEAIGNNTDGKILINILQNGNRIQVDVCNNGQPIPPDIVPHIFIPFFTTRESGSGIGLSISRYMMRLHGGNLKHYIKNSWTIFSMIF